MIDKLLAHPLHAAVWATKFSDITGNNTDALEEPAAVAAEALARCGTTGSASASPITSPTIRSCATSSPPPASMAGILKSGSRSSRRSMNRSTMGATTDYPEKKTLDLFWRRQQQVPIEQWGEKVAAAFLGVRLECAQCHKHPTDRWTQDEYWAFANLFAQVTCANNQFSSPELRRKLIDGERRAPQGRARQEQSGDPDSRDVHRRLGSRMRPNPSTVQACPLRKAARRRTGSK